MIRTGSLALAVLVSLVVASPAASHARRTGMLTGLQAGNGGPRFAGDGRLVTTISPNGDGFRDRASIRFHLATPALVHLEIAKVGIGPHPVFEEDVRLPAGDNLLHWAPPATTQPRTYLVLLTATSRGIRESYGARRARDAATGGTPVIRVQGVDAAFGRTSYSRGSTARIAVATDARTVTLRIFRVAAGRKGPGLDPVVGGTPVTAPVVVAVPTRLRPFSIEVPVGAWPSGVYFARLVAGDGRVGYAPFVLRPEHIGLQRVAVVLPTNTWQAYNFEDRDGNGWGDTWYAGWVEHRVRLGRHYLGNGIPPHFTSYDLPFLRWVAARGCGIDYLSDADLDRVISGARLARAYDLIVFPGHHEYVTSHEYDIVTRYRNLGGNLAFLSANNFFWRVARHGAELERTAQWRTLEQPEASLIGAQYRGNDEGTHRAPWIARGSAAAPWLFEGTGLRDGSAFGRGGIEIDATAPSSPAGTIVLAEIPDLYGPGFSAQMTYYESPGGAKVFAAGAFELLGATPSPEVSRLLANLWARLTRP